jgi:uncharacterized membrane protein YgdD (TMEM256/DUF423 family)
VTWLGPVAALLALTAVVLAALGSHAIAMNGMAGAWQTASNLHLFSAAALLGLAALGRLIDSRLLNWGAWAIVVGTVIFSGSIYFRIISGYSLGGITPFGGMLMMFGWLLVFVALVRKA